MISDAPTTLSELVVLTVDSESYTPTTVDLAIDMAASLKTRLQALFIEDEELLRAAELPFTREIAFPSAMARVTDANIMQRSVQTIATQFKQYLGMRAQASKVPWSYDYIRGCSRDVGLVGKPDVIYTIVSQAIYHRPRYQYRRHSRKLLMIENHSPHLYKALELIVRSFRNDAIEVLWIKNDSATTETDVVKQYPALSGKNNLTTVQLEHSQLQQVVADRNMTFDYAIMSRNESADSLNEIFKQLRCPIILVS